MLLGGEARVVVGHAQLGRPALGNRRQGAAVRQRKRMDSETA